jgi:hypothetical protein
MVAGAGYMGEAVADCRIVEESGGMGEAGAGYMEEAEAGCRMAVESGCCTANLGHIRTE